MTRILIATTVSSALRAFFLPFARAFSAQGWRVDAMARDASSCSECADSFGSLWDVDWERNPFYPGNLLRAPHRIREIVEREGYDLIIVSTPIAAFVVRYAIRGLRTKINLNIIYIAQGFRFYKGNNYVKNAFYIAIEKIAGWWTDYLVVVNRDDAEAAHRLRIVPPERLIHMLGIGVDTQRFSPDAVSDYDVEQFRSSIGLAPGSPLFSLIGEFIPRKRHRDALIALSKLNDSDAHLALAGDGPESENMRRLAAELGIEERVHFLGFRRDVPVIIRASVAALSVSSLEGLPVNVTESLSLGVPVIGSDIRGTRDLLEDECGITYPPGDSDRLAEAMTWILHHLEKSRAMGARGRAKMQGGYSRSEIINNYINIIYEISHAATSTG